jgi:hypothetical protein
VYIDVGLGFHAQMTLDEAGLFGEAREARLTEQVEELSGQAAELKAKIKIAVGAIDEVRCRLHASPLTLPQGWTCRAFRVHHVSSGKAPLGARRQAQPSIAEPLSFLSCAQALGRET